MIAWSRSAKSSCRATVDFFDSIFVSRVGFKALTDVVVGHCRCNTIPAVAEAEAVDDDMFVFGSF